MATRSGDLAVISRPFRRWGHGACWEQPDRGAHIMGGAAHVGIAQSGEARAPEGGLRRAGGGAPARAPDQPSPGSDIAPSRPPPPRPLALAGGACLLAAARPRRPE